MVNEELKGCKKQQSHPALKHYSIFVVHVGEAMKGLVCYILCLREVLNWVARKILMYLPPVSVCRHHTTRVAKYSFNVGIFCDGRNKIAIYTLFLKFFCAVLLQLRFPVYLSVKYILNISHCVIYLRKISIILLSTNCFLKFLKRVEGGRRLKFNSGHSIVCHQLF
jgi:hypothetical protein